MAYDGDETLRRNRNHSWWKQRTNMERRGIILLIVAVIIIIGLIVGVVLESKKRAKSETEKESVCVSEGCVETASNVITKIDRSVDPCDNFYDFACGGFRTLTEIPDDKPEVSAATLVKDVVQKQLRDIFEEPIQPNEPRPFALVKNMYEICMNTTAIELENLTTVVELFKDAGGWPLLEGLDWNEAAFEWKTFMHKLRMLGANVDSFINIGAGIDPADSTKLILTIDQEPLNIGKENLLVGFGDEVVDAYFQYLVDLATYFGVNRQFAEFEVRNVINFKIEIAKISHSDEERHDVVALNHVMTIEELQNRYPSVTWLEYINGIIGREDRSINNTSTMINVLAPQYVNDMLNLLATASRRDQANYVFFQILYSLVKFLPDYVRNREQTFTAVVTGTTIRQPRWTECVEVTSTSLGIAASALYVRRYFHEDARKRAVEMISDVRTAFIDIVKNVDWMDETTKQIAIDKASSITATIGYPDEYLDNKKLEDYYALLNFTSGTYINVVNDINMFIFNKQIDSLWDPINKTDWKTRLPAVTVNAQYAPQENSIELPAGILQGAYFNKDRPHFMNYGAIAYVIAHEITHGFDDLGKQFDKDGKAVNWWANETNEAFAAKAKCIIDQYSAITVPEVDATLNGVNSQSENIADNGGIKEAYLAYDAWVKRNGAEPTLPGLNFTSKQLFWISAAQCWCSVERPESLSRDISSDEHSPNRYRVLVPFSNTEYFAKDFNCPIGSKMNPKHKCKVW